MSTAPHPLAETRADGLHDHGHAHPKHLAHHFDDVNQQYQSAKLGMWVFLVTEMLMFSGLFMGYIVLRFWHPELFHHASRMLDLNMGAINTIVLIFSSFTMALGIRAAQLNQQKMLVVMLLVTLACAGAFMVIKYFEYSHKWHVGTLPGKLFQPTQDATYTDPDGTVHFIGDIPNARSFFGIYFTMTGLHGIHVLVGMGLLAWLAIRSMRGHFNSEYFTPVEMVGLYWHIVDLIWIFLFPLLYLVDRT